MQRFLLLLSVLAACQALSLNTTTLNLGYNIERISISDDGRVVVATAQFIDLLFYSTNYGVMFSNVIGRFSQVVVSGDGKTIAATEYTSQHSQVTILRFTNGGTLQRVFNITQIYTPNPMLTTDGSRMIIQSNMSPDIANNTASFYQLKQNSAVLLFTEVDYTQIAFSPSLDRYMGHRYSTKESAIGVVDWTNRKVIQVNSYTLLTQFQYDDMQVASDGTSIGCNGYYCLVFKNSTVLPLIGESLSISTALSDDGNTAYVFNQDYNRLIRYSLNTTMPFYPYDSVPLISVQSSYSVTPLVVNKKNTFLYSIDAHQNLTKSTIATTEGEQGDLCSATDNCGSGLQCGGAGYCFVPGKKAQLPPVKTVVSVILDQIQIIVYWYNNRNNLTSITCEKAGSFSVGTFQNNPVSNPDFYGDFDNLQLEIAFVIGNTTTPFVSQGMMTPSTRTVKVVPGLSKDVIVRLTVICKDASVSNSNTTQYKVNLADVPSSQKITSPPTVSDSAAGMITAALVMVIVLAVLV